MGRRGADNKLKVPVGLTIYDDKSEKIGELNQPGDTCIVASGGVGGCSGNNFVGTSGQERVITLDLKLIADVGMVNGFFNLKQQNCFETIFVWTQFRLDFQMPVKVHC